MERERLTRLVQDAAAVERGDLADLRDLTQRFPWFSGAHVLLAAGVQKAGEVLSEETVRASAAHIPSRTALFDLVHAVEPPPVQPLTVVPKEPPIATPPVAVEKVRPVPAVVNIPIAVEVIIPELELPVAQTSVSAEEMAIPTERTAEEQALLQAVDDLVDQAGDETPTVEEDPLERQILEAALASAYDFTWSQEVQPGAKHIELPATPPEPLPIFPPQEPLVPIAPFEHKRAITRHDKLSFTAWLDATEETAKPHPPDLQRNAEIPTAISDWIRAEPEVETPPAEPTPEDSVVDQRTVAKPVVKPLPKESLGTSDLIDRFINQQPPVAAKSEFYTPQQAAKRSLDDTLGLVTETLARVYEKQGNLPKAIDAYHRLALKYPAKSAYFAALQKELEGQLNK